MRKVALLLGMAALACAAPLAGCTTTGQASATAQLAPEKALFAAEAAYNGVVTGVEVAVDGGLLKGAAAQKATTAVQGAYAALTLARSAEQAGNVALAAAEGAKVLALASDLQRDLAAQGGAS